MTESRAPKRPARPFNLDRRSFLRYVGTGASVLAGAHLGLFPLGCAGGRRVGWVNSDGGPDWISPPYPVPLPGDGNDVPDATRLATYEVRDELVLPEGFRYDIIAQWGDRFGPEGHEVRFGYNNDYTGLTPIAGHENEYWLFVNHEYVSVRPWSAAYEEVEGVKLPEFKLLADEEQPWVYKYGQFSIDGWQFENPPYNMIDLRGPFADTIPPEIHTKIAETCERGLDELGVSVLRVRRLEDGRFEVLEDATDHRRIAGKSCSNVPDDVLQQFRFSGPSTWLLSPRPVGTISNCSGGTTPWGTFLTCEENFHYEANEEITPEGQLLDSREMMFGGDGDRVNGEFKEHHPVPSGLNGLGYGIEEPLDGREYGWVCEVFPESGQLIKHTALGRFHHENVALRCEEGKRLAAYMGDDRRGGHVWKFVSDGEVTNPQDPANSSLLERGTLYVARFREDKTGEWIALAPETPLRRPEPEHTFTSHVQVPARFVGGFVGVGDTERDRPALEVDAWVEIIENFCGKPFVECTLGDLVRAEGESEEEVRERLRGILVMDAFVMANSVGGTPTARPEDLEVHPKDQSVYIAFTDATDGSAGAPDRRIFPDSNKRTSRQYGAVYRVVEDGDDPAATTFSWGNFVSSGEVAEQGGGFASADNLVFDPDGNLWMVTDITRNSQNFPNDRAALTGTDAGGKQFPGIFGNNALFMIPTSGAKAGIPHLFAIGPMECEMCGPTFTEDGRTLILSIQHPGEKNGARQSANPTAEQVQIIHDRDNNPFEQIRTVPLGSNFPHGELDRAPRPCVVCITREVEI